MATQKTQYRSINIGQYLIIYQFRSIQQDESMVSFIKKRHLGSENTRKHPSRRRRFCLSKHLTPKDDKESGQPLAGPNMQPELLCALSHWQPCCSQVTFVDTVSQNSNIIFRPTMQDFLADRKRTVESKR